MTQWQEFLDPNWTDNALVISTRDEEESGGKSLSLFCLFSFVLCQSLYTILFHSLGGELLSNDRYFFYFLFLQLKRKAVNACKSYRP